jgi:hypothetical protein
MRSLRDGSLDMIGPRNVIASEAKQSRFTCACAVAEIASALRASQ